MRSLAELWRYAIPALWAVWIVGWIAAARDVKRTRWRESRHAAIWNRAPVLLGVAVMLWAWKVPLPLNRRVLPDMPQVPILGMLLVAAGLTLTGWARWCLGRNWSGDVTVKEEHTLITSGPYRAVRHPIYSGLLLALVGTALAIGSARGFVATALILTGLIVKLTAEEARMRETFAEYADYARRTARLIPGLY